LGKTEPLNGMPLLGYRKNTHCWVWVSVICTLL
jgi:hypothetical protein